MNDMPGFARAQREWEDREPPDDGPCECDNCNGAGDRHRADGEWMGVCSICKGSGLLTANGEPFDPHKAENDACDRADMQRDEMLTREPDRDPPEDHGDF